MLKRFFLYYFFCSTVHLAYAQEKSFNQRYVEVSVSLIATDVQAALQVSDSLLSVAKTDEQRAKAYMLSANIYMNLGEQALAIRQVMQADEIVEASLNSMWQATTKGFLSTAFRQIGLIKAAERYINQAEEANNRTTGKETYILTKINIFHERAMLSMARSDYEMAKLHVLDAGRLIVFDHHEDKRSSLIKATNHQLLGLCYLHLDSLKEAEEMYLSSLSEIGDVESNLIPYIFRGLAEVSLGQDSLGKARMYLEKAEPYLEGSKFKELEEAVYRTYTKFYWKAGEIDGAMRYGNLLWEIRSEREKEIRKVSDTLFEEMYNTKESYRDKFKITLIIGLCLAVSTIFLTLYLFFLSRTRSTHHIVAKQKDESATSEKTEFAKRDASELREINISKETEQRLLKDIGRYEERLFFLDKDISLGVMARLLNTNQRYVSYIIKKHRGKDFYGYVQAYRIQFIIDRLKADPALLDYKLAHLAEMSGFTSLSQFSTAFKTETGLPPSAFVHFRKKELGRC